MGPQIYTPADTASRPSREPCWLFGALLRCSPAVRPQCILIHLRAFLGGALQCIQMCKFGRPIYGRKTDYIICYLLKKFNLLFVFFVGVFGAGSPA